MLSELRPRIAYILDHQGRARSRRLAQARSGEDRSYLGTVRLYTTSTTAYK